MLHHLQTAVIVLGVGTLFLLACGLAITFVYAELGDIGLRTLHGAP